MRFTGLFTGLFTGTFLLVINGYGQSVSTQPAWKKRVTRVIDMTEPEAQKQGYLKVVNADSTILQILVAAALKGNVPAFSNDDNNFSTPLSKTELRARIFPRADTQVVVNPVTEQEELKIEVKDLSSAEVNKYRVVEDWIFDPSKGKTEIQIVCIAPLLDAYGPNGESRGVQALFYLRYSDAGKALGRYEQYHPNNTFAGKIWDDYFQSNERPKVLEK